MQKVFLNIKKQVNYDARILISVLTYLLRACDLYDIKEGDDDSTSCRDTHSSYLHNHN